MHLLGFNDFHGNLEAAGHNIYGQFAGGAAYLAKAIRTGRSSTGRCRRRCMAGDNIGASPLANGLFYEEPATIATNLMNVDFASVGNHEFDKGSAELRRIQNGGCHRVDGAPPRRTRWPDGGTTNRFPGADFQYLAANVIVDATGKTLFPAYGIKPFRSEQRADLPRRLHRRGPRGHADDRDADRSRRSDVHRRGRGRQRRGRQARRRAWTRRCS